MTFMLVLAGFTVVLQNGFFLAADFILENQPFGNSEIKHLIISVIVAEVVGRRIFLINEHFIYCD